MILIVGPTTRYTAYLTAATVTPDDVRAGNVEWTEEIDFDVPRDFPSAGRLSDAVRWSGPGQDYCWDPEHPVGGGMAVRVIAIRDNRCDDFIYDERRGAVS